MERRLGDHTKTINGQSKVALIQKCGVPLGSSSTLKPSAPRRAPQIQLLWDPPGRQTGREVFCAVSTAPVGIQKKTKHPGIRQIAVRNPRLLPWVYPVQFGPHIERVGAGLGTWIWS